MSVEVIQEFLGVAPLLEGVVYPEKHKPFHYSSERLKYELFLDLEEKCISISAAFEEPFGYNSLYEISVEFDRVQLETELSFYGGRKILVCRKNYPNAENFRTLMIIRWDDEELSVWPSYFKT
jgi:hypothetical protein